MPLAKYRIEYVGVLQKSLPIPGPSCSVPNNVDLHVVCLAKAVGRLLPFVSKLVQTMDTSKSADFFHLELR